VAFRSLTPETLRTQGWRTLSLQTLVLQRRSGKQLWKEGIHCSTHQCLVKEERSRAYDVWRSACPPRQCAPRAGRREIDDNGGI
jgi:hypothetical protein